MSALRKSKTDEKLAASSGANADTTEQSERTHSLTENSSRRLTNVSLRLTSKKGSKQKKQNVDELEAMKNLLAHIHRESAKRIEMLKFAFDKNFDEKIKTCINTSADMEARAAAFEAIIQSETLIKKPVKEITIENNYEEEFGMNFSQTGSTSEEQITSPPEQQRSASERGAAPISAGPSAKAPEINEMKKAENEPISTEHGGDSGGKITIKGFGEAALTKVGTWSKNAFNFFRPKTAVSGKDGGGPSRRTSAKTSHLESSDRSERAMAAERDLSRETPNQRRTRRTRKIKSRSQRGTSKGQRSKQSTQKGARQRDVKTVRNVKTAVKPSPPRQQSSSATDELKKRAAKLTEAKKRLKKRNAAKKSKNKKSVGKAEKKHPHHHNINRRGFPSSLETARPKTDRVKISKGSGNKTTTRKESLRSKHKKSVEKRRR